MVRVGGGWDTLQNYLNKHDPCRAMGSAGGNVYQSNSNLASASSNSFSTCNLNNAANYTNHHHLHYHATGM